MAIFLAILTIISTTIPVQAASEAVISVDKTTVTSGGSTVVTVKVQGIQAPGLAGYDFKINYDPAAINLVGLSRTSEFSVPTTEFAAPQSNPSKVPGEILVNAAQANGTTGDIKLFTLTFQALSTTPQVSPLTLAVTDFSYADLSDIPYTIDNGSITIENGSTPSLTVSPVMLTESSANDGSLSSGDATLTLSNGTFSTDIGKQDISITGVPEGMDYTVTRTSDTTLNVTVTGKALRHDNTNDSTLTLTVAQAKVSGATADVIGNIGLDFFSNTIQIPTVTSTIGIVSNGGTASETISEVPIATTLAMFQSAITPSMGATFKIYNADGITLATDLADGYKVIVTAEDGITKTIYTIHFANVTITHEYGNLNGDHLTSGAPKITSDDALMVLRIAARLLTPSDEQAICANVNGDVTTAGKPKITSDDALLILKRAARLITKFPVET